MHGIRDARSQRHLRVLQRQSPRPIRLLSDTAYLLVATNLLPAGRAATNVGTCCPQGQVPLSDGSCANLSPTLARIIANQGLCPLSEELQPDGTCVFNNTLGVDPACTGFPPLPQTVYAGPCCTPGEVPAQKNHQYTGTCCPVGQVPDQNTGSCAPQSCR